jgi:hypothetical protein
MVTYGGVGICWRPSDCIRVFCWWYLLGACVPTFVIWGLKRIYVLIFVTASWAAVLSTDALVLALIYLYVLYIYIYTLVYLETQFCTTFMQNAFLPFHFGYMQCADGSISASSFEFVGTLERLKFWRVYCVIWTEFSAGLLVFSETYRCNTLKHPRPGSSDVRIWLPFVNTSRLVEAI